MNCKDCLHYEMCDYGKIGNICADFAEETKEMSAIERLSYYRSLYYVKQRSMEKDILANDINDYITSDVQEVKHGKMNMYKSKSMNRDATYKCSVCGKLCSSYYNDIGEWNFCPNCGCKLDNSGDV